MRKIIPLLAFVLVLGLTLVQAGCSEDEEDPVTPATCSITVTTPVEGREWYTGDKININWDRTTGGNVMIELFKEAKLVDTIVPSTPNNGFFPWLQSTTFGQVTGNDYSVKVTHLDDSSCADQSGLFKLTDCSTCSIQFPWAGNDSIPDLYAGEEFEILWDSEHSSGIVDLELWYEPFTGTGTLVGKIAEDLVDSGSYLWKVDSFHQGDDHQEGYRFKIRDVDCSDCGDVSLTFKLFDDENCSIDVLGINGGHTYQPDEEMPISFSFEHSSGVVDLRLYTGNIPVDDGEIVLGFDTENGTINYNWEVHDFGHTGPSFESYNIRAWDSEDDNCVGQSSKFAIGQ